MSEETPALSAQIDNFERNRVCITVTRPVGETAEQLVQRVADHGYREEQWLPVVDSPTTGGPAYILDVRTDVAEAIYGALKARFEPETTS